MATTRSLFFVLASICLAALAACAPPDDPDFYREKAQAVSRDEPRRAVDLYRKAAELEADDRIRALDHFEAGVILSEELGDPEAALKAFSTASGLYPSWDRPYYKMYEMCLALGREKEARRNLTSCLFVFKGEEEEYRELKRKLQELEQVPAIR